MVREKIDNLIDEAIQHELQYDTDNVTKEGWWFLDNEAPKLVLNTIRDEYDEEELADISFKNVEAVLSRVITEYEKTNANIRYYE